MYISKENGFYTSIDGVVDDRKPLIRIRTNLWVFEETVLLLQVETALILYCNCVLFLGFLMKKKYL